MTTEIPRKKCWSTDDEVQWLKNQPKAFLTKYLEGVRQNWGGLCKYECILSAAKALEKIK